ncbi:MAG: FecR domain-containing protein [Elusimicrobia bacterium]|nr:FecR domain-containing protein [Elusimicrobiota bacterium]
MILILTKAKTWSSLMLLAFIYSLLPTPCLCAETYYGEIGEVKGTVEILQDGEEEWIPAVGEMPVQLKDRVKTAEKSSCNLELDDGSLIYIGENTETSVEILDITGKKHESKISLWFGKLIANIKKSKQTKMSVHTPTAICAVRGTEFAVETEGEESSVGVFDGQVGVKSTEDAEDEEEISIDPDQETTVMKGNPPRPPRKLSEDMLKYKERNEKLRERVKLLKERLKRTSLKDRLKKRNEALGKFKELREKRLKQKEKLKEQRDKLKGQRDTLKNRSIGGKGRK